MNKLLATLLLAISSTLAPSALAQQQVFTVNPQASQLTFTLGDVLHSVHGTFHVQSGSITFDLSALKMSGSVVVAAGSGDSGNSTRDKKMTKDILDAPQFAVASFSPASYQGTIALSGDSTVQVAGIFTLHGNPHELTLPMQIHIEGSNCTARTHFIVPYVQWGLKDPSTFLLRVAKEVTIDLTLVGQVPSER